MLHGMKIFDGEKARAYSMDGFASLCPDEETKKNLMSDDGPE